MSLRGPEPEQEFLSISRIRVKAGEDDWLAEVASHTEIGQEDAVTEWIELPGGRAHHVSGFFTDTYLFRALDEDAVIMISFSDMDLGPEPDDAARNRAMAETFRFEPND